MLMTGVLTEVRRRSRDDARRPALAAAVDGASAVVVPDKQVHRWTNEGGAVLPHD